MVVPLSYGCVYSSKPRFGLDAVVEHVPTVGWCYTGRQWLHWLIGYIIYQW